MYRRGALASLLAIVFLSGCASPPKVHSVEKTRMYNSDFEATWTRLIQYFSTNNIQIKTVEKASGIIYAERMLVDYSGFADCGSAGIAQVQSTSATLNVFVARAPQAPNRTTVTVNTAYSQVRVWDRNIWSVQCNSMGALERQILGSL